MENTPDDMSRIENLCLGYMKKVCEENPDPSHDILHVQRVTEMARNLAHNEKADLNVVIPAAILHDCVYVSKTDPQRKMASRISADKAVALLTEWGYPQRYLEAIHQAVAAHSFSANIEAISLEAKIVQDADRLDAMGAIGIARCFGFSGLSLRPFYEEEDPFCKQRNPDDSKNTLDHFFIKLLQIGDALHTPSAKAEAERRMNTMESFLTSLRGEIPGG